MIEMEIACMHWVWLQWSKHVFENCLIKKQTYGGSGLVQQFMAAIGAFLPLTFDE